MRVSLGMAKRKKKSVEEMSQAHGKVENTQPTTLDQVWGDTGMMKYGTLNLDEYKKAIDDMGKSDIFAHAAHVGIVPVDNRDQLTKRLIKEFQKYASAYQKPLEDKKDAPEVSPEVLKILSEGR